MKVVVNKCYGGFGLSARAIMMLYEMGFEGIDATPVEEYFPITWRDTAIEEFKKDPDAIFGQIFSPDFKFVLTDGCRIRELRDHPSLIKVVEELGKAANGRHAKLEIVEIPDGSPWEIQEYDGMESLTAPVHYY
jgi:hypothetical protein